MRKKFIVEISVITGLYCFVTILIPFGKLIFYPFDIFVTFLHEFGHALMALLSGGSVKSLQVNPGGSGVTITTGGHRGLILMGGYIGSAIFGNLMIYFSTFSKKTRLYFTYFLLLGLIISNIFWFSTISNFLIILIFSLITYLISKSGAPRLILLTLGIICVLNILMDFRVGPSSDLEKFNNLYPIGKNIWMIIWASVDFLITYKTIKYSLKKLN